MKKHPIKFEYHQEAVPPEHMAKLCCAAAQDGWRVKSVTGPVGMATSALAGAQSVAVMLILFERPKGSTPLLNGEAIRGVSRIQHDGK